MLVKIFSNLVCSTGDDGSVLLFLSSSITSSSFERLMQLGFDVVPLISNSLTSWFNNSDSPLHGDLIIIIKSLNFLMVLPLKFRVR